MSSDVQEIEQAIRTLPRREVEQLREWSDRPAPTKGREHARIWVSP